MKTIRLLATLVALTLLSGLRAGNPEREYAFDNYRRYAAQAAEAALDARQKKGLRELREYYRTHAHRAHERKCGKSLAEILFLLQEDGTFADLNPQEPVVMQGSDQGAVGDLLSEAFRRIWNVAEEFRAERMDFAADRELFARCRRAVLHYGDLEVSRSNRVHRWHASCFAIPTAAVNIYFCFLPQMERAEAGKSRDPETAQTCDMLKALGLQAWTQPLRNDATDRNVVQTERFRGHVFWVGGNALAYRSLLPVAVMYRSAAMIEVIGEVSQRGIGNTAQLVYDDAFWTEGCTADGAGWGHGKQCLVWGYPIDGNLNALSLLTLLAQTPWGHKLSGSNVETLFNFIQGSSWFYYKGYPLLFLDRYSARYAPAKQEIRSAGLARQLMENWPDSFGNDRRNELTRFLKEAANRQIVMKGYPEGVYSGTRWFFNNDKLIKKNPRYHIAVSIASVRCDGLESAREFADAYNFFPTDGMTLFQKQGDEYARIVGAWDVTAMPGITAREGMELLPPVTNWRGYCSRHDFAAAATHGGENAVAGYLFEKMNASNKDDVNDKGTGDEGYARIFGVKAHKAYFMLGDYTVALGAGVANLRPELEGSIRTTVDQTERSGEVTVLREGRRLPAGPGEQSFFADGKPVWVIQQDKFAYTVLPEFTKSASFRCETKATDWLKYNLSNKGAKELPERAEILHLWIDHGQAPTDDTYGYVVYAGEGLPAAELPFEVLRNDTQVQALASRDGHTVEAVFYTADAALASPRGKLTVSAPCALLLDGDRLTVTDARMDPDCREIVVTCAGRRIPVAMPQGILCGKPATTDLRITE